MILAPVLAHASASPCAQLTVAQSSDCPWNGTITLSRTDSGSTSTPLPATGNDRGGSQTHSYAIHDVAHVQVQGDQATATRERSVLNTITNHDAPGAQCGPGQSLSFGSHDTVDERQETQSGSAQVPVQVRIDPIGLTYSVQYAVPEPPTTLHHTFKESWNVCTAPKPQNLDQTSTTPAGQLETFSFSGALDPDDPTVMDGSHTDQVTGGSSVTVTWHLLSACSPCDRYTQDLAAQSTTLMTDAQTAHDLFDQVADASTSAQAESPELGSVVADLQTSRVRLDSQFSGAGDPTSTETYADALTTWLASSGIQDLTQIQDLAAVPQPDGEPRALTLAASPLTQSLQSVIQQMQTDRDLVSVTQLLLNECHSGAVSSGTSPSSAASAE
jgi:hypothetical protein